MCFVASCNDRGSVVSLRFEPLSSARALAAAASAAATGPEAADRGPIVTWWDSDGDHLRDIPALVSFTEKCEDVRAAPPAPGAAVAEPPLDDYYYDDEGDEEMEGALAAAGPAAEAPPVPAAWSPLGAAAAGGGGSVKPEPMSPVSIDGGAMVDDEFLLDFFDADLPDRLPTSLAPQLSDAPSGRTDGALWSDGGDGFGSSRLGGHAGAEDSVGGSGGGDGGGGGDSVRADAHCTDPFAVMFPDEALPDGDVEMGHERRLGCVYRKLERVGGETIDGRRRRGRKRVHPKPPSRMLADLASIDGCTRILEGVAAEATARQVEMQAELAALQVTCDGLVAEGRGAAPAPGLAAPAAGGGARAVKLDDWSDALEALRSWSPEPEAAHAGATYC